MAFYSPRLMFGPTKWADEEDANRMETSWIQWALNPRHKPLSHEFVSNVKAGVTVALVNVPLSISLALAAGATPTQGIVTAFWCGLISALFSSSHFNVVGPTGALSGMLAVVAGRFGPQVLPIMSLYTAAFLLIFFLLRVDRYMRYVCTAVAHGFSVGVALIIVVAQLPAAFGLSHLPVRDNVIEKFEMIVANLPSAMIHDSLFFFVNVVTLFYCATRWGKVPWAIIFAGIGIAVGMVIPPHYIVLLNDKYPNLSLSLASPIRYDPTLLPAMEAPAMIMYSLGAAVVGLLESLISAQIANQMVTNNDALNYNTRRETFGLALANVASGIFGGIPGTAALARTSLNVNSGAWSRVAGLVSCATLALLASVLLPYFEFIPMSTISALLILVAYRLVDFHELRELRLSDTPGTYAFFVTCAFCLMTDTFVGLIVGACLSIFFNLAHVGVVRMEVHETSEDHTSFVAIVQSAMVFTNTEEMKDAFLDVLHHHKRGQMIEIVLDDCQHVDFDGAKTFSDIIKAFRVKGWSVRISGDKHIAAQLKASCPSYARLLEEQHVGHGGGGAAVEAL